MREHKPVKKDKQMDDFEIIEAMLAYGGSFVEALARCWQRADKDNQKRLKLAFPEIWEHYTELAKTRKA
jgi:uncharacterized protein YozE (UPF0346 family)